ncbi:hypothetical protein EK0264_11520 [Epidermidibacterium keratini]|uniref:Uncharacterized protein n=1 Tax=Epidermidibacterium keratini TaxID=1891644 RepID=A0A7L4YPX5_9ACTN|nr:hypothetical protein [Epidermidibacterium keratini]QHC00849.1 hypothetical protein EK0264_11520 [Epidermidibacterium keratini]
MIDIARFLSSWVLISSGPSLRTPGIARLSERSSYSVRNAKDRVPGSNRQQNVRPNAGVRRIFGYRLTLCGLRILCAT